MLDPGELVPKGLLGKFWEEVKSRLKRAKNTKESRCNPPNAPQVPKNRKRN